MSTRHLMAMQSLLCIIAAVLLGVALRVHDRHLREQASAMVNVNVTVVEEARGGSVVQGKWINDRTFQVTKIHGNPVRSNPMTVQDSSGFDRLMEASISNAEPHNPADGIIPMLEIVRTNAVAIEPAVAKAFNKPKSTPPRLCVVSFTLIYDHGILRADERTRLEAWDTRGNSTKASMWRYQGDPRTATGHIRLEQGQSYILTLHSRQGGVPVRVLGIQRIKALRSGHVRIHIPI